MTFVFVKKEISKARRWSRYRVLGLKPSVEIADVNIVEFIAMLLLAPLIWTSTHQSAPDASSSEIAAPSSLPRLEAQLDRVEIHPPSDGRLTMVVLEHGRGAQGSRAPASVSKTIEVIVTAP